ncbi:hypothetical protein [Sanyastnella coralliicola]|uniref:hypothetical protein n=1 Tax=Sanyastnella coralliicola TaxID=3069118 RepID=UPI0027B99BD7|nr:hypothetical protein [Longitalea sp. SCSIO 12813]
MMINRSTISIIVFTCCSFFRLNASSSLNTIVDNELIKLESYIGIQVEEFILKSIEPTVQKRGAEGSRCLYEYFIITEFDTIGAVKFSNDKREVQYLKLRSFFAKYRNGELTEIIDSESSQLCGVDSIRIERYIYSNRIDTTFNIAKLMDDGDGYYIDMYSTERDVDVSIIKETKPEDYKRFGGSVGVDDFHVKFIQFPYDDGKIEIQLNDFGEFNISVSSQCDCGFSVVISFQINHRGKLEKSILDETHCIYSNQKVEKEILMLWPENMSFEEIDVLFQTMLRENYDRETLKSLFDHIEEFEKTIR